MSSEIKAYRAVIEHEGAIQYTSWNTDIKELGITGYSELHGYVVTVITGIFRREIIVQLLLREGRVGMDSEADEIVDRSKVL